MANGPGFDDHLLAALADATDEPEPERAIAPGRKTLTQVIPREPRPSPQRSPSGTREVALAAEPPVDGIIQAKMRAPASARVGEAIDLGCAATGSPEALPESIHAGVAALSGIDLGDVRVHRGSSQPASLGAEAFARGRDIHLGPGADEHLPHEAWHLVQQRQGRVAATTQHKGAGLNDDPALEREADEMGARIASMGAHRTSSTSLTHASAAVDVLQGKFKKAPDDEWIDEETNERYVVRRHRTETVIVLARKGDGFEVPVDTVSLESLETDPELIAIRLMKASMEPPPDDGKPSTSKPKFELDPSIPLAPAAGKGKKKGGGKAPKRLREETEEGDVLGRAGKQSPFMATIVVRPTREGVASSGRQRYSLDELAIASVAVSDNARGKTKYKKGQKDHTVAWALVRYAMQSFAGRPLADLFAFLQRGIAELASDEETSEGARERAKVLDPGGKFLSGFGGSAKPKTGSSEDAVDCDTSPDGPSVELDGGVMLAESPKPMVESPPLGPVASPAATDDVAAETSSPPPSAPPESLPASDARAPIEYWNDFASNLLREYVVTYQRSGSATTGHGKGPQSEDKRRDALIAAEQALADKTEVNEEAMYWGAEGLLDLNLKVDENLLYQAIHHWHDLLQIGFPRVMNTYGAEIWKRQAAKFKPSAKWKERTGAESMSDFLGDAPSHGYAAPEKPPSIGLGVYTTLTCHVPVAPTEEAAAGIERAAEQAPKPTGKAEASDKPAEPAVETYAINDLLVGHILLGDERPPTRWGKDQRSHTTSWVLVCASLRSFSNQPLADLHGYLLHTAHDMIDDLADDQDRAVIKALSRASGSDGAADEEEDEDSETGVKAMDEHDAPLPAKTGAPSDMPAESSPPAKKAEPASKKPDVPTWRSSAAALVAQLKGLGSERRSLHQWYVLVSQSVRELLRIYQLTTSATYARPMRSSENSSERPGSHGEPAHMVGLQANEEHLAENGYLCETPEQVVKRAVAFLDVESDNETLPWRSYARAVLHWQTCLWNAFPNIMRVGADAITKEVLGRKVAPSRTPGWMDLPPKVKTVADMIGELLVERGGWNPLMHGKVELGAPLPALGVGKQFAARETVGRGDCGINGFALGLMGMVAQGALEPEPVAKRLVGAGFARERFDALLGAQDNAAGARAIQADLAPALRRLAVDALRQRGDLLMTIIADLSAEVARRRTGRGDRLGAVPTDLFDDPSMSASIDDAVLTIKVSLDDVDERRRDADAVTMTDRWAHGAGLDLYLDQLGKSGTRTGGLELTALADVFGVHLLRIVQGGDGTRPLVSGVAGRAEVQVVDPDGMAVVDARPQFSSAELRVLITARLIEGDALDHKPTVVRFTLLPPDAVEAALATLEKGLADRVRALRAKSVRPTPVLGMSRAGDHWSALTTPGGAFDLTSDKSFGSAMPDLSLWRHDYREAEADVVDGDPTLRAEGTFVSQRQRAVAWRTAPDNNCAFNGLGLTLAGLVHQGRLDAANIAAVTAMPVERVTALAGRIEQSQRDQDASLEIETAFAGPLRAAAVVALRAANDIRDCMFEEFLEHVGGRVRAALGMGEVQVASDLFQHGSPLAAPLAAFADEVARGLRNAPPFAAPPPPRLGPSQPSIASGLMAPLSLGQPVRDAQPLLPPPSLLSLLTLPSLPAPPSAPKLAPKPSSLTELLAMPSLSLDAPAREASSGGSSLPSLLMPLLASLPAPSNAPPSGRDDQGGSARRDGGREEASPAWVRLVATLAKAPPEKPAPERQPTTSSLLSVPSKKDDSASRAAPAQAARGGDDERERARALAVDARLAAVVPALRGWFNGEGMDLYTANMQRDKVWAGGPELQALGRALGIRVTIFRDVGAMVFRDEGRGASGNAPVTELLRPHVHALRVRELIEGGGNELAADAPTMTFQRVPLDETNRRLEAARIPEPARAEFLRLRGIHYRGLDAAPEVGMFRHQRRGHWSAVTTERGAYDLRDERALLGEAVVPSRRVDAGGGLSWLTSILGAARGGRAAAGTSKAGTMKVDVDFVQTDLPATKTAYPSYMLPGSGFDASKLGLGPEARPIGLVNAANSGLRGGGYIDGAIHALAGQSALDKDVDAWALSKGKKPTDKHLLDAGDSMTTGAGALAPDVANIIHTVGPMAGPMGLDLDRLRACCQSVMREAAVAKLATVVFCNISSNAFGGNKHLTATTIHAELSRLLANPPKDWAGWMPTTIVFNNFPGAPPVLTGSSSSGEATKPSAPPLDEGSLPPAEAAMESAEPEAEGDGHERGKKKQRVGKAKVDAPADDL